MCACRGGGGVARKKVILCTFLQYFFVCCCLWRYGVVPFVIFHHANFGRFRRDKPAVMTISISLLIRPLLLVATLEILLPGKCFLVCR